MQIRKLYALLFLFCSPCLHAQVMQIGVSNTKNQVAPTAITLVNTLTEGLGMDGGTSGAVDMNTADLCIVGMAWFGAVTPTFSSSPANTWLTAKSNSGAGSTTHYDILYVYAPMVSDMMTFTASQAGSYVSLVAKCFKNTIGTMVDQVNGADDTSTTSPQQPGSVTPGSNGEVIFTGMVDTGGTMYAINSSFNTPSNVAFSGGTYIGQATSYLVQGSAAAVNPTWTWTGSNALMGAAGIATFK